MSTLLVISGPIAAGKSTVASALAAAFRDSGRSVAVVDLDRLYMMLDDRPPMSDPSQSREARRAAAALTDHFVLEGIELVVVEGTFWRTSEREQLTTARTTLVQPMFVTLRVSVDEALRRVQSDSSRRASRNPAILRASHAAFGAVTPILTDAIIDSSSLTTAAVTVAVMAALEHLTPPETHAALVQDIACRSLFPTWRPDSPSTATLWVTRSSGALRQPRDCRWRTPHPKSCCRPSARS